MDLEQLEALARGEGRDAALAALLPGTAIHDYWRAVHLQHRGALDEVDAILAGWRERHVGQDDLCVRLGRRQLLLRAGGDLAAYADELRRKAFLTLDDQAEAQAEAHRFPTRLDPALVDGATLVQEGLRRGPDLEQITSFALTDLVAPACAGELDLALRRRLVQRLPRANVPGVVTLVAEELADPSSRGVGALPITRLLTLDQLVELGGLIPSVCEDGAWVDAILTRLRPPAHVDWENDLAARRAYLDALEKFVEALAPSFNALKAEVLQHQLDLDRRLRTYDRARFLRYLELPRQASYVEPSWLRRVPEGHLVRAGAGAAASASLAPVGDDEALVRDYLAHFLTHEEEGAFAERLRREWLITELATARLLAGDPDVARWTRMLPEGALAALRDRVDIELSPRNPARFGAGDPVALEVFVKNVPALTVKVFRIDVLAYFAARAQEVDTSVDLDGMIAGDERTLAFDAPSVQRIARRIELPGCARPGTYVVELIGNGRSSRALIRKGGLRHTVRTSAAGPTVRVYDDEGRPLPDARLWMGGREHAPREDGEISIPFSTQPDKVPMLLLHGDVAQREVIDLPAESYELTVGIHLEREVLVPGETARLLLRPTLEVASTPAPIALVEDPRVEITVTDLAGTSSTKIEPVVLHDDAETVVSLRVPEDAIAIAVWLRGRVRVASTQQTVDVADGTAGPLNLVHESLHTEVLHLATSAGGHVLHLLGKTGEPRAGRAVALSFDHVAVNFAVQVTLGTDERGRIELGHLPGVERVTAVLPSGIRQTWSLREDTAPPNVVHVEEGAEITLPAPPDLSADALVPALSLTEQRAGAPARDASSHVRLEGRALVIAGLGPGTYELSCRGFRSTVVTLRVVPASPVHDEAPRDWSTSGPVMLELSPPLPLVRDLSLDGADLVARLSGAGASTRVHLVATTFRPDPALASRALAHAGPSPLAVSVAPALSHYVSGRDIGDEQRYVIERRSAARRPGVLLDKPSLLLDPWALRATSTAVQAASAGAAYGASAARAASGMSYAASDLPAQGQAVAPDGAAFATVDFLAAPAVVIENLRPDADGVVRVLRESLGPAQHVRLVVVDPALTTTADLPLPETAAPLRDRRLRLALDPARHFAEERRVDGVVAGTQVVVDDVRSGKLELVDTVARAHTLLLSLGGGEILRELSFVAQWSGLDRAAQRTKYSKYACHELNLFLFVKDPAFFAAVVRPHLAGRRHRTFVDRFLLGEDLTPYLEPWAFGRLNTLEKVLLARRVPAARDSIVRFLGDAVDLIPPDPERDARLVDSLLGAAALEEGGVEDTRLARFAELSADDGDVFEAAEKMPDTHTRIDSAKAAPPGFGPPPPSSPASLARPQKPAKTMTLGGGGKGGAHRAAADLLERGRMEAFYRAADRTQEWAETGWWHRRVAESTAALVPPNRFWRDLAAHGEGPFLSAHLGECAGSFTEALSCLAFLDLPFVAGPHDLTRDDVRLTLTAGSDALCARTRLAEIDPAPAGGAPILVGQGYLRADDRWDFDGAEQREKYVTGELCTGVVYMCHVVVTNPTSASQRLDVLLQIPRGAVPVNRGFLTRTMHLHLGPYGSRALDYAFYFPAAGRWTHFPAHVTRAGALAAFAEPTTLDVVRVPTVVDAGSWAHVSQHGTTDEVVAFLERENLGRVDLGRIAWRMRDRDAFARVTALLAGRHVYHDRLWAYGLLHADRDRSGEWLRHQDGFIKLGGPVLEGGLLDLDPIARGWYQHLEYAPLVNARVQRLGRRRHILNDALDAQYRAFLDVMAHRARPTDDDLLAAAHYLFCLDRQDDALAALEGVRREHVMAPMPYDYLAAYAACCRGDLDAARRFAAPWIDHPVDRWRFRFGALVAVLDEAEQKDSDTIDASVDPDARDRKMADLAARQPSLELTAERGALLIQHHQLASCQVRFHRMDIELYFSRQPFLQGDVERFSWIEPGHVLDLPLGEGGRTAVPIPEALRTENLVVEARAGGLRVSAARYAHDLAVQVAHTYGQLRVLRASTQAALPAAYVKVYARRRGGDVAFYKDGYTDVRGRFDYVTLSTDDLDRVERFALLVVADHAGATVLEAAPPQR